MMNQPKKVLVAGHDQKFWYPLQTQLEATGLFEFREDLWIGHEKHDPDKTLELMEWADIIVAEWTLGNAVFCAKHKKPHQRLVTRFHAQEIRTDYPAQLEAQKVDCFVFVGPHLLDQAVTKFSIDKEKSQLIYNFVDFEKFNLSKFGGEMFNLGMIGIVPAQKRLDLALDVLEQLADYDSRYMLHIKGAQPTSYNWLWARTKEKSYYEEVYKRINSTDLRYKVVFDPPGTDVNQWLKKIGFILSPSDSESFHMALAEGMASGSIPVPWRRDGVDKIFGAFQLFDTPVVAAKFIESMRNSTALPIAKIQCTQFIKNNFEKTSVVDQWVNVLLPSEKFLLTAEPKSNKKDFVIIFYAIDAWDTFHRREMIEALADNLKNNADILIIEPGSHYKTLLDKGMCEEVELNSYARLQPIQVADNIYKIRILQGSIPKNVGENKVSKTAESYEKTIQVAVRHIFGMDIPVVHWIYKPDQRRFACDDQPYIYEVYDEYTMDFSTGVIHKAVAELEPDVLRDATHVFFTSEPLANRKKRHCISWSVVGNGVAFDVFDAYRFDVTAQPGLRKSIGYLGNLSDFFDWSLMADVCERMPNCDFFFHGQVESHRLESVKAQVERLQSLPNTHFSGRVTRMVGAAAINRYDALTIPFVVNDAMHAVNPLKLWEYFATGKPVVSTPMDAINVKYPLLRVADAVDHWVELLQESVNEVDQRCRDQRISLAKENSWERLTAKHTTVLLEAFKNADFKKIKNSNSQSTHDRLELPNV